MKTLRYLFLLLILGTPASAWGQGDDKKPKGKPQDKIDQYPLARPPLGAPAPDFFLYDLEGTEFHLKDILGKKPIVIEFGSYT